MQFDVHDRRGGVACVSAVKCADRRLQQIIGVEGAAVIGDRTPVRINTEHRKFEIGDQVRKRRAPATTCVVVEAIAGTQQRDAIGIEGRPRPTAG